MTDTCFMCGFKDYSTFYKAFLKKTGISPKTFKNNTENLNIIEDYYKTDENQCNLFNLNSAESSKNENTEEYNPTITSAISQTTSTTTEEYGIKDETTGTNTIPQGVKIDGVQGIATKFNIKEYKTNSATFFNSVKDVENFDEAEYPTEHTYVSTVE